jgi:hypothetical protein
MHFLGFSVSLLDESRRRVQGLCQMGHGLGVVISAGRQLSSGINHPQSHRVPALMHAFSTARDPSLSAMVPTLCGSPLPLGRLKKRSLIAYHMLLVLSILLSLIINKGSPVSLAQDQNLSRVSMKGLAMTRAPAYQGPLAYQLQNPLLYCASSRGLVVGARGAQHRHGGATVTQKATVP